MKSTRLTVLAALLCAGVYAGSAYSQTAPEVSSLGIGIAMVPKYEGAKNYTALPMPLLTVKSGRFFIRGLEAGYAYPVTQQISVGPMITIQRGRDDNDASRLNGLGDIDVTAGLGGFISGQFGAFNTTLKFLQSSRSSYGATIGLDAYYTWQLGAQDRLSFGASTAWGNNKHMQTYFGITPDQAASSKAGLPAYNTSSGMTHVRTALSWTHAINQSFSVLTMLGATTLTGDAKDSPIVERRTSLFSTLGVIYRF